MSVLENAQKMQAMIGEGKVMEAFEQYYDDQVQVYEMPTGEHRNGKEAQRNAIQEWFGMVKEAHGGGVDSITANEETGVACVEGWTDFTAQDGNRVKMQEVAVQQWKDGKIVQEKFYYNMPGV